MKLGIKALEGAFRATTYRVETDTGRFDLRIGVENAAFDAYLRQIGVTCWAVLTACNPGGVRDDDGNVQRQVDLLARITALGYLHFPATNLADDKVWPAEHGYLLLQPSRADVRTLAMAFSQLAFVWGEAGHAPHLFWLKSVT